MNLYIRLILALLLITLQAKAQIIIKNDSIDYILIKHISETPFYQNKQVEVDEEDLLNMTDNLPAFDVFRDTYFTTGIPLNTSINQNLDFALNPTSEVFFI